MFDLDINTRLTINIIHPRRLLFTYRNLSFIEVPGFKLNFVLRTVSFVIQYRWSEQVRKKSIKQTLSIRAAHDFARESVFLRSNTSSQTNRAHRQGVNLLSLRRKNTNGTNVVVKRLI